MVYGDQYMPLCMEIEIWYDTFCSKFAVTFYLQRFSHFGIFFLDQLFNVETEKEANHESKRVD